MTDDSEIKPGEYHPIANEAIRWFRVWQKDLKRYAIVRESIASTALSGNRMAQICNGTLDRLEKGDFFLE